MARDFRAVIRYQQWRVDEQRRALGTLLGEVAGLEYQTVALENSVKNEQQVANSDPELAGFMYGAFAQSAIEHREELVAAIARVEEDITEAQDLMREIYLDFKTFELAQTARDERLEADLERQAQAVLDELGLVQHQRRKGQS